jgi:hypothetical protein
MTAVFRRDGVKAAGDGRAWQPQIAALWRAVKYVARFVPPIVVTAALVWLAVEAFGSSPPRNSGELVSNTEGPGLSMQLTFGVTRGALTRSTRINLCAEPAAALASECPDTKGTQADAGPPPADINTLPDRPQVQSVGIAEDLPRDGGGGQFPANQISLTATNVGREGLLISVTADPSTPHQVLDGNYSGVIVVDRAGLRHPLEVQLHALLDKRTGKTSERAIAALLLGALLGGGIKWLDTVFTPMALLRRRQHRLRAWLVRRRSNLPEGAVSAYDDATGALRNLDTYGVEATLGQLSTAEPELLAFAYARDVIRREIAEQQRLLAHATAALPDVANAIATEQAYSDDLVHRPWPWEATTNVRTGYLQALEHARALTAALRLAALNSADAATVAAANTLARQIVVAGSAGLEQPLPPTEPVPPGTVQASRPVEVAKPRAIAEPETLAEPPRNFALLALDNIWWISLVITAAVVTFVGYQTQFLNNKDFDGSLTNYVQLFGWALALQIAGTTIIQVTAGLTSAGAAGSGTTAPA